MPRALPGAKREAILADVRAGKSCRQAARDHGVSAASVSKLAKDAGVNGAFKRSQVKEAVEARAVDIRAERQATSARFLRKCNEFLDRTERPHLAFAFGGRDNTYNEHLLDEPPVDALRSLLTAAAIAFDKHLAQDKHDADDNHDLSSVDSWLDSLTAGAGH
jgi:transposase-like protein